MRTFIAFVLIMVVGVASAQDSLSGFQRQMEVQRAESERLRVESRSKLREAIIGLRDARQKSCQFGNKTDCSLAELSSVELVMLDIDDRYRSAASRSQNENRTKSYKTIQEMADELRSKTDELADAIDKADK